MSGRPTLPHGAPPRAWAITFEDHAQRVTCKGAGAELGAAVTVAFKQYMRRAMERGGCCGFSVTVHVDGPDCDHEVG